MDNTLNVYDVRTLKQVVDAGTQRGKFRPEEMEIMGTLQKKLDDLLKNFATTREIDEKNPLSGELLVQMLEQLSVRGTYKDFELEPVGKLYNKIKHMVHQPSSQPLGPQ